MKKMPISELTKEVIYNFIVKNGGTLEQLAERYACDEAKFMSFVRKKTGKGGWKRVAQYSAENAKRQKEQVSEAESQEGVIPQEEDVFYYVRETEESLKSKQKEIKAQYDNILSYFKESQEVAKEADEAAKVADRQIRNSQEQIAKAEQEIFEAKQTIAEAIKDREYEEERQSKFALQLKQLEKENEEIARKLMEIQEVILVAPNYQGDLPVDRNLVSSVEFSEGVEVEQLAEVEITVTISELITSGFETIQEYADVMAFVALCGEYKKRGKKHKILVDDERVKNIFIKLGIEE